ncbi:hypothetical protein Tsubulata_032107 [Turnera subulata]|uniref:Uncharacterized protein n=1 Tax=Turnera subulata TaxID=218843 RepID=A0A9Q0FGY2_9ROSI|nr:hypothetical protein Tsubulata_032107 [Turnera subulata]
MVRPEADASSYQTDQPHEFNVQQTQDDFSHEQAINETSHYATTPVDQYQNQFTETPTNDPQQQQQYQQPPPPPQQQAAPQQYPPPPQANQAYSSQPPTRAAPYPPQAPQISPVYPNGPNQPAAYPPQGPQAIPAQPVQFPPRSPQTNPMYSGGPNQPAAYPPPQGPQAFPPQQATPPHYPQGGPAAYQAPPPQAVPVYNMPPQSPLKPTHGIPVNQMQSYNENWSTGLFDCMEDPSNALITACFPCVTFGQIAEIIDNGGTPCATSGLLYGTIGFCIGMPCLISCGYRTKLRAKYGLMESPAPDWLTHCIFEWCALCQEYRELQNRGLDPAIGWQGNVAKQSMQQAQIGMMPPMNQRMMP